MTNKKHNKQLKKLVESKEFKRQFKLFIEQKVQGGNIIKPTGGTPKFDPGTGGGFLDPNNPV